MSPEKVLKERNILESLKGDIETPSVFKNYGSTGKKSRPTSSKKTSLKMRYRSIDAKDNNGQKSPQIYDDERRNSQKDSIKKSKFQISCDNSQLLEDDSVFMMSSPDL